MTLGCLGARNDASAPRGRQSEIVYALLADEFRAVEAS